MDVAADIVGGIAADIAVDIVAVVVARNAALDKSLPRPIYILGMIVHNKHILRRPRVILQVSHESKKIKFKHTIRGSVLL